MKKSLVFFAMMFMSVMAYAQDAVKVSPKMKKGDVKVYIMESTSLIGGNTVKMTSEATYTVADKLAEGYEMDVLITKFDSDAGEDLAGRILTLTHQMMKGYTMRLQVDKDGKAMKILNYYEVKAKMEAGVSQMVDELMNTLEMPPMITKEMLMSQFKEKMTEEALLGGLQKFPSPVMLNGKTIATGTEEEFIHDMMSMKAKRTYTVNGNLISTKTALNMSKEDMKKYIISQVEKLMPDQAEMIKQNIDMVINNGMMKMEMEENATYELQADGWVKSIKGESNISSMGTENKVVTNVTLK